MSNYLASADLTAFQQLILATLAARLRAGETSWTFPCHGDFAEPLADLTDRGLISVLTETPDVWLVSLTQAGQRAPGLLDPTRPLPPPPAVLPNARTSTERVVEGTPYRAPIAVVVATDNAGTSVLMVRTTDEELRRLLVNLIETAQRGSALIEVATAGYDGLAELDRNPIEDVR